MRPTRKRDLAAATVAAAVIGYLLVVLSYRWFPPITVWTGLSLLAVAIAEVAWGRFVRSKINEGHIGDGPGWLHALAAASPFGAHLAFAGQAVLAPSWPDFAAALAAQAPRAVRAGLAARAVLAYPVLALP